MGSNAKGRRTKSKARLKQFEELQSKEFQKRNETSQIYIPPGPRLGDSVIEFNNVSKAFGDKYLINDLSFKVPQGAIVGIIGPNGAGKTTLFNMISGTEQPDEGSINIGSTVELAYVSQSREDLGQARWRQHQHLQDQAGGHPLTAFRPSRICVAPRPPPGWVHPQGAIPSRGLKNSTAGRGRDSTGLP